jgi:SAM-dependent methyltransferase
MAPEAKNSATAASDQAHSWSRVADVYEQEFLDPYRPDVKNPLLKNLDRLADARLTAADLGCGIGPLLPELARRFRHVYAVDFAEGMLRRARARHGQLANVEFRQARFTDLRELAGKVDVAVAVNSLVLPDVSELDESLRQIHSILRPGGRLLGIVPAMDAVHYYNLLLVDRALSTSMPLAQARKNAALHGEHGLYDFAFGQFRYLGLEQHFWQHFEVRYRLRRAGFRRVRLSKVRLSWAQFACGKDLADQLPPWDWFFLAEVGSTSPGEPTSGRRKRASRRVPPAGTSPAAR